MTHTDRLDGEINAAIDLSIQLYGRNSNKERKFRLGADSLCFQRVTDKLRNAVKQYCRLRNIPMEYSTITREFMITINLDMVTMSLDQAQRYDEATAQLNQQALAC
jgi:hypothetical protein